MSAASDLDDFLIPLAEVVTSFGDGLANEVREATNDTVLVTEVEVDLPFEIAVETMETSDSQPGSGIERLLAAPPTQHLVTSIMPALHNLKLRLEPSEEARVS